MGRIKRGWRLAGVSWTTLRSDRSLAAFPILGGLAALFWMLAFGLPAVLLFTESLPVPGVILAALAIYFSTFAGVFFNVALAAAAAQVLDGEDATVASGLAVARHRVGAVAGWAGILASVNIVIQALQSRAGPLVDILLGAVAVAWALVTFLVIPVIALENLGPIAALKRSASIFRQRWGEQVAGQFTIGFLVFAMAAIPAAILVGIGFLTGSTAVLVVLIALAAVIVVTGMIIAAALTQIFAVALYRYAIGEGSTGAFAAADLAGVVAPRRRRWGATG